MKTILPLWVYTFQVQGAQRGSRPSQCQPRVPSEIPLSQNSPSVLELGVEVGACSRAQMGLLRAHLLTGGFTVGSGRLRGGDLSRAEQSPSQKSAPRIK